MCIHITTWSCVLDSDAISKIGICYLNIAGKLVGRFRSDVIEIPVTEYIIWNMHTFRDLLCFITVK